MKNISYTILLFFIRILSRTPFFVLYRLSDLLFIVVFYLIPYRKKTVIRNMRNAFPAKTSKEINTLVRKFYRYLCDFLVESLKPLTLSTSELNKRFRYLNPELMDELNRNQRNYALVSGHYCNWEFNSNVSLHAGRNALVIYRPLQNKNMDRLFKKIRSRYESTVLTPMENVYRVALEYNSDKRPFFIWFIADQRPPRNNKFWTTFLNQPTSFFNGVEKLSRKLDLAVVYMHVDRVSRGYYEVTLKKLYDSVAGLPEDAVTLAFVEELEKDIIRRPELWLWSHKRWKHKPDASNVIVTR